MKIITLTYLIIIITFFYACSKCEETTGRTETLDLDFQKLLFPYENYKSVKFLRNKKDTIIFYNYGLQTNYNYTYTQEDCPTKIPLEQKFMQFADSLFGDNFYLNYYINSAFYDNFAISINNTIYTNENSIGFIKTSNTPVSVNILNKQYDTVTIISNVLKETLIFKKKKYGLLQFTNNGNLFELIP